MSVGVAKLEFLFRRKWAEIREKERAKLERRRVRKIRKGRKEYELSFEEEGKDVISGLFKKWLREKGYRVPLKRPFTKEEEGEKISERDLSPSYLIAIDQAVSEDELNQKEIVFEEEKKVIQMEDSVFELPEDEEPSDADHRTILEKTQELWLQLQEFKFPFPSFDLVHITELEAEHERLVEKIKGCVGKLRCKDQRGNNFDCTSYVEERKKWREKLKNPGEGTESYPTIVMEGGDIGRSQIPSPPRYPVNSWVGKVSLR